MVIGYTAVVDPVDHMELRLREGGDTDVVDLDRNGHGQGLISQADGQLALMNPYGGVGIHVDTDVEGGSPGLGLPFIDRSGDLVNIEGSLAGDEMLDRLVIRGTEHLGVAVQGHGGGQKLVYHRLTPLHGERGGDGLAALQLMVGQHLKASVRSAGGIQLRLIRTRDTAVGIYPFILGKHLIVHRFIPFFGRRNGNTLRSGFDRPIAHTHYSTEYRHLQAENPKTGQVFQPAPSGFFGHMITASPFRTESSRRTQRNCGKTLYNRKNRSGYRPRWAVPPPKAFSVPSSVAFPVCTSVGSDAAPS